MKKTAFIAAAVCLAALFNSCNNTMEGKNTHSSGEIDLYLEESYKPLFETSIYTFEGQYPHAVLHPHYVTESGAIKAFFDGKTSTICITREFTDDEKKVLRAKNVEVRSDKMAKDAVALIVNPNNPDSTITVDRVIRILKGEEKTWGSLQTDINVVFDNVNSANFNYLKKLAGISEVPSNIFAVKSNEEVIEYVKNNKSALGIIGVNWISDEDDPSVLDFLDGITVMEVAEKEGKEGFKPYQSYIYTKEYPLTREVWLINKAGRQTLNTGFVLFMIGEKGQLIIQKSSLVPANMVARLMQINVE